MNPLFYLLGLAVVIVGLFGYLKSSDNRSQFVVYTYSSMASDWGPGPRIEKGFEEICQCNLIFRVVGDTHLMLQRLRLQPEADLLLGLDQLSLDRAQREFQWHSVEIEQDLYHSVHGKSFVPFDWAPMTFMQRQPSGAPPMISKRVWIESLAERSLALQDPRTSSPGLQLFFWLSQGKSYQETLSLARLLRTKAHSISPGWSTAYGLFQTGQANHVFSYTTSPIYHILEEKRKDIEAVSFSDPLPVQVEFAGIPQSSPQPELAKRFLQFLLSETAQTAFMEKNYMLPILRRLVLPPLYRAASEFQYEQLRVPLETEIAERLKAWSESAQPL